MSRTRAAMRAARWIVLAAALATSCAQDGASSLVDRDRDGFPAGADCDDSDPAVHETVRAYRDVDGDRVGAGAVVTFCTGGGPPSGYAAEGGDCAPGDRAAWRVAAFGDHDGDGHTVREPAPACVGAAPPEPYRLAAAGNDCDDADPAVFRWVVLYRDQDGDGAGARPRSIPCVGAALPSGWSRLGYDVDDLDPAVASDPAADVLALLLD